MDAVKPEYKQQTPDKKTKKKQEILTKKFTLSHRLSHENDFQLDSENPYTAAIF